MAGLCAGGSREGAHPWIIRRMNISRGVASENSMTDSEHVLPLSKLGCRRCSRRRFCPHGRTCTDEIHDVVRRGLIVASLGHSTRRLDGAVSSLETTICLLWSFLNCKGG